MALCRLTVLDFTDGTGQFNDGMQLYDAYDLEVGAGYARDLLGEGHTVDPVDGFDLAGYAAWCERRLKEVRG